MKKLTAMNSDSISIKLRKWNEIEKTESDRKYFLYFNGLTK